MANAPGIINQELKTANEPISADDVSVAAFMGVAQKGPLATPTLVRSFKEFKDIFGSYQEESDLAYAVETFFVAGGKKAYVSRLAHYSDIADASTAAGAAATLTLNDTAPAPAHTLTINGKYSGEYGNNIKVDVVSNPLVSDYAFSLGMASGDSSVSLASKAKISEGQILRVSRGDDATDLDSCIRLARTIRINYEAHVQDPALHGAVTGPLNPALDTFSDLAGLILALNDLATQYDTHVADGVNAHTAPDLALTTTSCSDLPTAIVLANEIKAAFIAHLANAIIHQGGVADTDNIIEVEGYGKVLSVSSVPVLGVFIHTITFTAPVTLTDGKFILVSEGVADSLEFDINVYYEGSLTPSETFSQMTMESDLSNYAPTVINDPSSGSILIAAVDSNSGSGIGLDFPVEISSTALTGGVAPETGLVVLDYIGSSESGLGFNAFDSKEDVRLLMLTPSGDELSYNAVVLQGALDYCAARTNLFLIAEMDPSLTATQALAERSAAGYNSSFGALYFGRVEILDKDPAATSASKFISPLGYIAGKYAHVDNLPAPDGGAWNVAAGFNPYGNLPGVLSVEKAFSSSDRALLNDASINIIRDRASQGILIYGARTLSESLDFRYINTRRLFILVQQSIANSVEGTLFRNNNANTWKRLKSTIRDYLNTLFSEGALKGNTPSQAYFVKVGEDDGVQTPTDTDNGRLIVEIGLAPQKPAEFLIFRYSQYDGGADIA